MTKRVLLNLARANAMNAAHILQEMTETASEEELMDVRDSLEEALTQIDKAIMIKEE